MLISIVLFTVPAAAGDSASDDPVSIEEKGSITISYSDDADGKEKVTGAVFRLYKAADIGKGGERIPLIEGVTEADITGSNAEGAAEAERLIVSAYEKAPGRKGTYTGMTDSEGILKIDDIDRGVYLVKEISPVSYHYPSSSFFVSVPYTEERKEGQTLCYDIAAEAKPNIAGDLSIEKILKGKNADKDRIWHFVFTVDSELLFEYEKPDGTKGKLRSGDTIELKGGEKATVRMIPAGAYYTVTEKEAGEEGYMTVAVNEKGNIRGKGLTKVTYTNAMTGKAAVKNNSTKNSVTPKGRSASSPETGDDLPLKEISCLMILSLTVMLLSFVRRRSLIRKLSALFLSAVMILALPVSAYAVATDSNAEINEETVSGSETMYEGETPSENMTDPEEDTEDRNDAAVQENATDQDENAKTEDPERPDDDALPDEDAHPDEITDPDDAADKKEEPCLEDIYRSVSDEDIIQLIEDHDTPGQINPVGEIYMEEGRDEGLLQMAAIENGKLVKGDTEEENGRQSGDVIEFDPAAGMAKLSSFILADTKDGAGDFDSDDKEGNDSSDRNKRIRVHDDITYTFAYSTSLAEDYIYKTVRGGKVYAACVFPEGTVKEDGLAVSSNGNEGSYITLQDGRTAYICQIVLGDGESNEGNYDIPGAGTFEITLRVESSCKKESIGPEFYAWLDDGKNEDITGPDVLSAESDEITITSAPFADVIWYDTSTTHKTDNGLIYTSYNVVDDRGRKTVITGRRNRLSYRIIARKPNGHAQGVRPLSPDADIVFTFSSESEQSTGTGGTADGMSTVYTASTGDRNSSSNSYSVYDGGYEEAVPDNAVHSNGYIASAGVNDTGMPGEFKIETDRLSKNYGAGSIISTGHITMVMKEAEKASGSLNSWTYKNTLTLESIRVTDGDYYYENSCDLITDTGRERKTTDAVNVIEREGGYFNRIYIRKINPKSGMGTGSYYTTQELAPDANVPLGEEFGAYIFFTDVNETLKRSYDYITLWDNSLMEYRGFSTYVPNVRCFNNTYHYYADEDPEKISFSFITKRKTSPNYNGGIWKSDDEMRTVNVDSYSDLCFFSSEEKAREYGSICGIAAHIRGLPGTGANTATFRFEVLMRSSDGAEAGSTAMFCGVNEGSASPDEPIRGGINGKGTMPQMAPLRPNNTAAGRLYEKSSFTSIGTVIPSSLTENNWVGAPGNSVWFFGNSVCIDEKIENGATSATYPLSGKKSISYDILPGFKSVYSETQKMSGRIESIIPDGLIYKETCVRNKNGEYIRLEPGRSYNTSDFIEGGKGKFHVEYGNIPSGLFYIPNAANEDAVLGTSSSEPSHGTNVILNNNNKKPENVWELIPLGRDTFNIRSRTLRKAVEDKNGSGIVLGLNLSYSTAAEDQNINVANPNNANAQKWIIERSGEKSGDDGTCYIRSYVDRGYVIAPRGRAASPGTDVRLFSEGSSTIDKWCLTECGGNTSEKVIIYYSDITAEGSFPEFRNNYDVDRSASAVKEGITNTVSIYDRSDPEAVITENGKVAKCAVSFTNESQYVLKKTVDKAVMERDEELVFQLTAENLSGEPEEVVITDALPEAELEKDGSVSPSDIEYELLSITGGSVNGDSAWSYMTDGAEYLSGSRKDVKTIEIRGCPSPGERAVFTISVKISGLNGGDRIRNRASMRVKEGRTIITADSNKTETRVKGFAGRAEVFKSVDRNSSFKGADRVWTISSTIPEDIYRGDGIYYEFHDDIDPERKRLTYSGELRVNITSSSVDGNVVERGEVIEELEKGEDYTVKEPSEEDPELKISLTLNGIGKLEKYASERYMLEVSYCAYINENGVGGERVPNDVTLHYGDLNDPDDASVHPDEVNPVTPYVYTGTAEIKKTDSKGRTLAGASFMLYTDPACENILDEAGETGRECTPGAQAVSDGSGSAKWDGLADGTYYVKEESAPFGYELQKDILKIVIKDGYMDGKGDLKFIALTDSDSIPLMTGGNGRGRYYAGIIIAAVSVLCLFKKKRARTA